MGVCRELMEHLKVNSRPQTKNLRNSMRRLLIINGETTQGFFGDENHSGTETCRT